MIPAPAQVNNGASTASTTPDKRSTPLLNDPIFAAIHNAFLMGWGLVELKSRVQITACNLSLDSITYDQGTSTFDANILNLFSLPAGDTSLQQPSVIDAVLKNIVLKDVATPKSIESGSKSTTTTAQSLSAELRDNAWLTSVLRAIFKQIVTLHLKRFPGSDTTNTIYDLTAPPEDQPPYTYPYLYSSGGTLMDYANVGISSIQDPNKQNDTIDHFVKHFKLYDATRRALNCLTLLLDDAKESLVPATIDEYQRSLVQALLAKSTVPEPDDIKAAVKKLSNLIIRLLEAWDSFLRESFYVDTNPQLADSNVAASGNGIDLAADNEIELAAYEAGRSMASLSWNVSVAIVPLDSTLTTDQQKDPKLVESLTQKARSIWLNAFNDRDVNHVQYQIAALCTALDAAYYRVNPGMKAPSPDDSVAPLNPDLPSQAIQAVKRSLDYWQRTVALMCDPDGKILLKPVSATAPTSAVPGTSTPPVNTVPKRSKLLDWEMSKTLCAELVQQAVVWQSLLLCQQSLQTYRLEIITQRILNDFMQDLEKAVRSEISKHSRVRWVSIGIAAVIFVLILWLIATNLANKNFHPDALLGSPLVIVTAIGALVAPFVTGITSWLSKLGSFFGAAGTAMEQALQRGYDRMLIEFDYLNHNVSITFPLVEFFVWDETIEFDGQPIQDGYDFLVNVFWTGSDREEEFRRVARAAFGPISAFIAAQLNPKPAPKPKPAPSPKPAPNVNNTPKLP